MLTRESTVANVGTQILVTPTAAGTVAYTVPPGKTFYGRIICGSGSYDSLAINGITIPRPNGTSGYEFTNLELVSGTIIASTGFAYNFVVIGFER